MIPRGLFWLDLKAVIVIIAAVVVVLSLFASFYFFTSPPSAVDLEKTPYYDSSTSSVVLANNTASLSGLQDCDIFISGPSKQIKFFETVSCDSLSSVEISKDDMMNLFDSQKGIYTVIINSEINGQGKFLQFAIQ